MYLNFQEISGQIPFIDLLNHLNIPFKETKTELKTDLAIINKAKNLFFYKATNKGGSVINFYSDHADCTLREAGTYLVKTFLKPGISARKKTREIPDLELKYHKYLEVCGVSEDTARELEIGYVKQRSVMSGKIAFTVHGQDGNKVGYVGKEVKNDGWFVPKGLSVGDHIYNLHRAKAHSVDCAILVFSPLEAAYLVDKGFGYTVGLFGRSATDKQIMALKEYKRIILIHPEPENIALRLANSSFIKYAKNSVRELEDVKKLF